MLGTDACMQALLLAPGCCVGLQHSGLVATKRLSAPMPHCSMPRWPETPLRSLPPAALKDPQAERCFRVAGKLLAYLSSPTFCISK